MYKISLMLTILAVAVGLYYQSWRSTPAPTVPPVASSPVATGDLLPESDRQRPVASPTAPSSISVAHPVMIPQPPAADSAIAKYPQVDDSYAPFDEAGNLYITQITINGKRLSFHGDLLIGDLKDLPKFKKMPFVKFAKPQTWPNNQIPFVVADDLPVPGHLSEAIDHINDNTNIKFIPRTDEKDYVAFRAGEDNCYSYVGRTGGEQHVYLSEVCGTRAILHELMHTLGFFHEQNRENRDEYVKIFWENIPPEHQLQFKKMPDDFMHVADRPFSYQSIMLYPSSAFAISPDEPSIIRADGELLFASEFLLADEDINRINLLYPLN